MSRIWKVLTRKKAIDPVTAEETRLSRILNVFDLTALGVGSTLGVGVYVLAGQVAKTTAGPSVVLSFLIAAIASVFAGLCYAEFGARAPRAGSAYIYSYVCVGEFIAFVIGWNLILEYVIGSASVARGLSLYLDTLINGTLQNTFREIAPINVAYLASYFDFFSCGISILLAIGLAFGLKESSMANNIVTCLNILVILFIIIAGSLKANPENWRISPNATNNATNSTIIGNGGFFPFGVEGMIKGAATCFYGFVGFDCIATTGEEVKNPRKAIPISIIASLSIIFFAYFGVATVLTLMVPYYLQDFNAPIPRAFEMMGWEVAKWIVSIGALFGLFASLFGAMFPLPRIIYAMGSDGLIFKFLAKVHPKFQSPIIGTLLAGLLTGLMSALFDLSQLVNMMSIGTLQAYTIVAASVLLLRYTEEVKKVYVPVKTSSDTESVSSESSIEEKYNDDGIRQNFDGPTTSDEQELINSNSPSLFRALKHIINFTAKEPNRVTENIVTFEVLFYCLLCVGISLCVIYLRTDIANGETWAIVVISVIVGLTVLVLISLVTQPKSKKELSFKVPLVPFIPALSIMINIYLMLMLDYMTWVRFALWMAVGIPMYCICACTNKAPLKQQNGGNYATNITNGHAKILSGISNPTFVHTEINGREMRERPIKKKAAPPPPTIFETPENMEVQQEAVIADLEEILEKEEAISQLDDVLKDAAIGINDRKLSAGSLSNTSVVASQSEDVVADVHCANVVTPVADPKSISFPTTNCDIPLNNSELPLQFNNDKKSTNVDSNEEVSNITSNQLLEETVLNTPNAYNLNISDNKENKPDIKSFSEEECYIGPVTLRPIFSDKLETGPRKPLVRNAPEESVKESPLSTPIASEDSLKAPEESAKEPLISTPVPSKDALKALEESAKEPSVSTPVPNEAALKALEESAKEPSISTPVPNEDALKALEESAKEPSIPTPVPNEDALKAPEESTREPSISISVPSEDALKTVTLRHVKKQIKQIEPTDNVNASNDNLKVGSKEYKNFIKDLDNKLKRTTVLPTFYAPRKAAVQPQPTAPNENVIEDHIDQVGAKEKLKMFYAARNPSSEEPVLPKPVFYGSKSMDETLLADTERVEEETSNIITNSELEEHKSKMANVFNSIKLKKLETHGDENLNRRLSKSLGSVFSKENDKTDHKHKMKDIFEDIKAIRKDT